MWDVVRGLPVCRLLEVPRRDAADGRDEWRDQRLAALVSAYHAGGEPVLVGWRHARPSGPTEVFVGGSGLLADRDGDAATLSLPAGGRGVMLPQGITEDSMAHWVRIGAVSDGYVTANVARAALDAFAPGDGPAGGPSGDGLPQTTAGLPRISPAD